jgi:subtilase family serine protease
MHGLWKLAVPLAAALAVVACSSGGSNSLPGTTYQPTAETQSVPHWLVSNSAKPACAGTRIGHAQCDVLIETRVAAAHRHGRASIAGWSAPELESYYNLPSTTSGSGQIVAVVDAYDNPDVASNLATYRSEWGLGTANFYKYNQDGQQSNYPQGDVGWGVEIDLDVEMVSASCPLCTIYLVEANSSNWSDIETAEDEAVTLGATVISNSYSGSGASESYYDTPGITYLASAGDDGYGLYDPATYKAVVAVGGTVLTQKTIGIKIGPGFSKYSESVWDDSGGGCSSTNETKPSWQTDPDCSYRTGNDTSAVAWDAAEYDTYGYGGWFEVGGTSVASPLVGGVFGLAGNSTSQDGGEALWSLNTSGLSNDLHAITKGSIVDCPSKYESTYLCKAGTNQFGQYSGPSGWGTPNGIGAY